MNLNGKNAVVIGASGGIGSKIVKLLENEGAKVISVSKSSGDYVCDLTDKKQIQNVCNKILADYNSIDLLFNIAGIGIYKTIEDTSIDDWEKTLSINLTAPFLTIKYLLPGLTKQNSVVVNFGSGMGTVAYADRLPYCTSKFGLRGMSLSLSKEFERSNPKVMLVTLGSVLTEFGPMTLSEKEQESLQGKSYLTPEWVAEKIINVLKNDETQDELTLYSADYAKELNDAK